MPQRKKQKADMSTRSDPPDDKPLAVSMSTLLRGLQSEMDDLAVRIREQSGTQERRRRVPQEGAGRLLRDLQKQVTRGGEILETQAARISKEMSRLMERRIQPVLDRFDAPLQKEIRRLEARVAQLEAELSDLEAQEKPDETPKRQS